MDESCDLLAGEPTGVLSAPRTHRLSSIVLNVGEPAASGGGADFVRAGHVVCVVTRCALHQGHILRAGGRGGE